MRSFSLLLCTLLGLLLGWAPGQVEAQEGEVTLPREAYDALIAASLPPDGSDPVPAPYAFGPASLNVSIDEQRGRPGGEARLDVAVQVLGEEWVAIPLLPGGTALEVATADGNPIALVHGPAGLTWVTRGEGRKALSLRYRVDAVGGDDGWVLPLPLAPATSTRLEASLPGSDLDVAVVPGRGVQRIPAGPRTTVRATLEAGSGAQLSWRPPLAGGHTLSRASYQGEVVGEALQLTGTLSLELGADQPIRLPLLPTSVTLTDVLVDGEDAAILVEGSSFAVEVAGAGRHTLEVGFEVPIRRDQGPPQVDLNLPRVPVSEFAIWLPGEKEIEVSPLSHVRYTPERDGTLARFHSALGERVTLRWSEAVPDEIETELRANASLYHAVHADEGVLHVRADVAWEVTRGETSTLLLSAPVDALINRIDGVGVADWRASDPDSEGRRSVTIFLDRQISGPFALTVHYERLLPEDDQAFALPLLAAGGVNRQRGMAALLSSRELTLRPVDEGGAARVGENQLPAAFRQQLDMTVAHTFKWVEQTPGMQLAAEAPERQAGRFDAQVDTLISLGEAALKSTASVEIDVKSGSIMELVLELPADVHVLSLSAPSMRRWEVVEQVDTARIEVDFTQEMEGQFRLEISSERIIADGGDEVEVPRLAVPGAEVEQGRIAVEALSAAEVQAAIAERLPTLDPSELPQQLVLRTTNPILLAHKYVQAQPAPRLVLRITRHREVEVQAATIDQAEYRTLITEDGLAVTTATWEVRNSSQQFLRVELPRGSDVWSAAVDGASVTPALAGGDDGRVLIRIINSTRPFGVELIYATPISQLGALGRIEAQLPRPDMVVTRSQLDLWLPAELRYGTPDGDMRRAAAVPYDAEGLFGGAQAGGPPRIDVPQDGVRFAFEKLYANQSDSQVRVVVPYASRRGVWAAQLVSLLAALGAVGAAGAAVLAKALPRTRRLGLAGGAALCLLLAGLSLRYPGVALWPGVVGASLFALGLPLRALLRRARRGLDEPDAQTVDDLPVVSDEAGSEAQPEAGAEEDGPDEDGALD